MTLIRNKTEELTPEEWNEMNHLRDAINQGISQVHYNKMEEFTEYLVRSLKEKGG